MKKGCLVKSLVVSTIFFAVVFYIFTNKFNEYIVSPLKNFAYDWSFGQVEKKLAALDDNGLKEDVISSLNKYKFYVKENKDISVNQLKAVADSLGSIIEDQELTDDEVQNFTKYIDEVIGNER